MGRRICRLTTTDPKQFFLSRDAVHIFERSSLLCVRDSNDLGSEAPPQRSDEANQVDLAASPRGNYDAMLLPSLSLPHRSRLRLTADLIVGVPYVLMLWAIDELRVLPERIASLFHSGAIENRREKCRKKQEARE